MALPILGKKKIGKKGNFFYERPKEAIIYHYNNEKYKVKIYSNTILKIFFVITKMKIN